MAAVTKTYKELLEFKARQEAILQMEPSDDIQPRVLMIRAGKKLHQKALEDYQEELETLRIKHCLKDEKTKKILRSPEGGYEYSEDGLKDLNDAVKKLHQTEVVVHYNEPLPYSELLATLPKKAQPYWQWEDVEEFFSPVYTND